MSASSNPPTTASSSWASATPPSTSKSTSGSPPARPSILVEIRREIARLRQIESDLRFKIDALFREHDITIPFPQRDVHIFNDTPARVHVTKDTPDDTDGEK